MEIVGVSFFRTVLLWLVSLFAFMVPSSYKDAARDKLGMSAPPSSHRAAWSYDTGDSVAHAACAKDGMVVILSGEYLEFGWPFEHITCFSKEGETLWKSETGASYGDFISPFLMEGSEGTLFITGGERTFLKARSLATGEEQYTIDLTSYTTLYTQDGYAFFIDDDGMVHALDAKEGALTSLFSSPYTEWYMPRIINVDGNEFIAFSVSENNVSTIVCYDLGKGELVWKRDVANAGGNGLAQLAKNGTHFLYVEGGEFIALTPATGEVAYTKDVAGRLCYVQPEEGVVIIENNTTITVFDENGNGLRERFTYTAPKSTRYIEDVCVVDDLFFFQTSGERVIRSISLVDGREMFHVSLYDIPNVKEPDAANAAYVLDSDESMLYLGLYDGNVEAYNYNSTR